MAFPVLKRTIVPVILRGVRISGWENVPGRPPFILAVSHVNFLDAPMVTAAVIRARGEGVSFLTKLKYVNVFGALGRGYLGMIPVDPADKKRSLEIARQKLAAGKIVGIFPEGTRNADPVRLLPGKTGVARLAHLTGLPVIPVGTSGPAKLSAWRSLRVALGHSRHLAVAFGPALAFPKIPEEQLTRERLVETTRVIMRAIGALNGKTYGY